MTPLILKEKEKENLCMKNAEKNVGRIHMKLKERLPLERQKETKTGARDQGGLDLICQTLVLTWKMDSYTICIFKN